MQNSKSQYKKILGILFAGILLIQIMAIWTPQEWLDSANAQPASVLSFKWSRSLSGSSGHACGGVVTADINGDGAEEVFYAGGGRAYCLNGTNGNTIWEKTVSGGTDQPQMADLNKDGILDLIVVISSSGLEVLYGQNGSRYWRRTGLGGECACSPIACDINWDGYPEVFFASTDIYHGENGTGRVTSLTHDGRIISQVFAWRPCAGGLSIADPKFDGHYVLYMGDRHMYYSDGGYGRGVRAFDISLNGTLTPKWDHPDILCSSHIPMLADVTKDGILDVVIGHQLGGLAVLNAITGAAIKKQLTLVTSDGNRFPAHYQPTVADIDYDGNLEILAADGDHPERSTPDVIIWDLVTWKEEGRLPHVCKMGPKVGDVTGDGQLDIIVASYTGIHIYTWNATLGNFSFVTRVTGLSGTLGNAVLADIDGDGLSELMISGSSGRVYAYDTPAPIPTSRPRSGVQFFSEYRLGVAEYVSPPGPQPDVFDENPRDVSTNVSVFLSELSFDLSDPNGDLMNYTVTTSPNIGGSSGTNVGNGRRTVSVSGLDYGTTCTWSVIVTDGSYWTNKTYRFTTEPPPKPTVSSESPRNGSEDVSVFLSELSFDLSDPNGDLMNYTVTTSPNIGGSSGTNVGNGRYTVPVSNLEVDRTYTWCVNVTDGEYWTNVTYSFTTESEILPWWDNSWLYRKKIVVDHSKVSEDLTNFPMLIDLTDGNLASKAQADGDDIVFIDENCVKLSHEIEFYNSSVGRLVAWVCANLSSTVDTVLYMYYGNAAAANQEDVAGVWNSNFMMVQHLSETSGTHYDSTVNDNDGSPQGGLNQNAVGKVDGADDFDGTDDYVSVLHDNTLTGYTSAMTASAWIKLDDVARRQTILNKYDTAGNQRGWAFDLRDSPTSLGFLASSNGATYDWWYASFSPVAGNWYQVSVVWESSQLPRFYVNSQQITTVNTNVTSHIYNNTGTPLYIGTCPYTAGRNVNGIIDEIRISNVARSAGWIFTSYNNQYTPSTFYAVGIEETCLSEETTIRISPEETEAVLDEDYTIYVEIAHVTDLYGWEFQLSYNPAILDLTSVSVVLGGLNEPTQTFYNLVDEIGGHLWWAVSTIYPTTTGVSYDEHAIFEMHFHTIAIGTAELDLFGTFLSDSNADPISHSAVNGSITVSEVTPQIDLLITNVTILDYGCSIYVNDTYPNGTLYYYPIEMIVDNIGTATAGPFYLRLEVYWISGSITEASMEILVSSLPPEIGGITVNFTEIFHPTHTGHYRLIATTDSRNNVTEVDETNNTVILDNIPVTLIGDPNGDGEVNILDAVVIALAWDATPSDPHWNIKADLNHDGVINILDAVRVAINWGKTS